jgi:hypothetical protein
VITTILKNATDVQLREARIWTSDHLHIPYVRVSDLVAVAYVVKHFQAGQLTGWDGFIVDIGL